MLESNYGLGGADPAVLAHFNRIYFTIYRELLIWFDTKNEEWLAEEADRNFKGSFYTPLWSNRPRFRVRPGNALGERCLDRSAGERRNKLALSAAHLGLGREQTPNPQVTDKEEGSRLPGHRGRRGGRAA